MQGRVEAQSVVLVYHASQREAEDDHARRQAEEIRRRLGRPAGIAKPGGKPEGMHCARSSV
mgnify:CR=1 FL=1